MKFIADTANYLPLSAFLDVTNKKPNYGNNLDALDGIRGLAVLIVIFAHTHSFGLSKHGGVGVWLFYSLSGFLLTLPLARKPGLFLQQGQLTRYFIRRVCRIFPAYYVFLIFWFLLFLGDTEKFFLHAVFLQADNHLWSIPQELAFYLVLPLIVTIYHWVFRGSLNLIIMTSIALTIAIYLGLGAWMPELPGGVNGSIHFMLGNFLSGVSGAYMTQWLLSSKQTRIKSIIYQTIKITTSISLILVLTTSPYFVEILWRPLAPESFESILNGVLGWKYPWLYALTCTTVIVGVVIAPDSIIARIMAFPGLRIVGIVSFSMYLFHGAILHIFKSADWPDGLILVSVLTPLTFIIALLMYHYIERPFMRLHHSISGYKTHRSSSSPD